MTIRRRGIFSLVVALVLGVTAAACGPGDLLWAAPAKAVRSSSPQQPAPATTVVPVSGLPDSWRGIDLERIPTDRMEVALTFDCGGSDAAVDRILATLAQRGVPATFFVTGAFARTYPERVRAIAAAGYPIGNHSDTHRSYPALTEEAIRADLAAAEASIVAVTGHTTRPLFRFPFGAHTDADIRIVNDDGYLPVQWTVDSLGWKAPPADSGPGRSPTGSSRRPQQAKSFSCTSAPTLTTVRRSTPTPCPGSSTACGRRATTSSLSSASPGELPAPPARVSVHLSPAWSVLQRGLSRWA
jgi:peptidoglycan/xylan/chitin deacetylase (PgdA/CDA1 family)